MKRAHTRMNTAHLHEMCTHFHENSTFA